LDSDHLGHRLDPQEHCSGGLGGIPAAPKRSCHEEPKLCSVRIDGACDTSDSGIIGFTVKRQEYSSPVSHRRAALSLPAAASSTRARIGQSANFATSGSLPYAKTAAASDDFGRRRSKRSVVNVSGTSIVAEA